MAEGGGASRVLSPLLGDSRMARELHAVILPSHIGAIDCISTQKLQVLDIRDRSAIALSALATEQ